MIPISEQGKKRSPISRYNLVIKQYNDLINRQEITTLPKAHNDFLYKKLYIFHTTYLPLLILCYFAPYLSLITLICNIYFIIIHEFALNTFRTNQKKIDNPLKHMIYEPQLCNRLNSSYLYYEIHKSNLPMFKFDKGTEEKILRRNENFEKEKLRFMVYNNEFIAGYYMLSEYRVRGFLHLVFNAVMLIGMHTLVYSPILCLSFASPMDSLARCWSTPRNFSNII